MPASPLRRARCEVDCTFLRRSREGIESGVGGGGGEEA